VRGTVEEHESDVGIECARKGLLPQVFPPILIAQESYAVGSPYSRTTAPCGYVALLMVLAID
jgi:hypothetical protein